MSVARVYEVTHRTVYRYDNEVTSSYGRAHLMPREAAGQRCRSGRVEVSPSPDLLADHADYFGNRSTYLEVRTPHTELAVTAVSAVEVWREPADLSALDPWTCAQASALVRAADPGEDHGPEFLLPSPQVPFDPALRRYAAGLLPPDRPLGQALTELVHRVHADIAYVPGATSVTTSPAEVLARREGVCQDLAHLALGCLRLAGLPARYVSGYLETEPPAGRAKLQGSDASHAWLSVLVPQLGWVDLDPTNDQPADARYVVTAWGRDYTDVPPLKGVIFTESGRSRLTVGVDVVRLSDDGP